MQDTINAAITQWFIQNKIPVQSIDDPNLLKSFRILHSEITLPTSQELAKICNATTITTNNNTSSSISSANNNGNNSVVVDQSNLNVRRSKLNKFSKSNN